MVISGHKGKAGCRNDVVHPSDLKTSGKGIKLDLSTYFILWTIADCEL